MALKALRTFEGEGSYSLPSPHFRKTSSSPLSATQAEVLWKRIFNVNSYPNKEEKSDPEVAAVMDSATRANLEEKKRIQLLWEEFQARDAKEKSELYHVPIPGFRRDVQPDSVFSAIEDASNEYEKEGGLHMDSPLGLWMAEKATSAPPFDPLMALVGGRDTCWQLGDTPGPQRTGSSINIMHTASEELALFSPRSEQCQQQRSKEEEKEWPDKNAFDHWVHKQMPPLLDGMSLSPPRRIAPTSVTLSATQQSPTSAKRPHIVRDVIKGAPSSNSQLTSMGPLSVEPLVATFPGVGIHTKSTTFHHESSFFSTLPECPAAVHPEGDEFIKRWVSKLPPCPSNAEQAVHPPLHLLSHLFHHPASRSETALVAFVLRPTKEELQQSGKWDSDGFRQLCFADRLEEHCRAKAERKRSSSDAELKWIPWEDED